MNSKDLNLASHMKEILDSGCVDSVKIEGRTKTSYYAATTAKAYRMAIDDYYDEKYTPEKYQNELESMQNRGFTDAYLVNRPFEKHDGQSLDFTMQMGSHQVTGMATLSGEHYMCKFTTRPGDKLEIMAPKGEVIKPIDNEYGTIVIEEGVPYLSFKQLKAQNNKIWEEVHSGNVNPITLPCTFPKYTFFRIPAGDEINQAPPV